jgi:PEP-CTERM motif
MISDTFTSDNSGGFTFEGHFNTAVVPEPTTLLLVGSGLAGLGVLSYRRRPPC